MNILSAIADFATILTAVVASAAALYFWGQKRARIKRLERYVEGAKADHGRGGPDGAALRIRDLMAQGLMTEAQVLEAAWGNAKIKSYISASEDSGADTFRFEWKDRAPEVKPRAATRAADFETEARSETAAALPPPPKGSLSIRASDALAALAALMGAAGVALAAASEHADGGEMATTASMFLVLHAGALLGVSAHARQREGARAMLALGFALAAGAILFAGDLATHAFSGARLFPFAAPIGGSLMILAWFALAIVFNYSATRAPD